MNLELFIAHRIFGPDKGKKSITRSIVNIAVVGIALGIVVMIFAVAIVTGFKKQVTDKVIGFGSHINIINYDPNNSYETKPISKNQNFYPGIVSIEGIKHIQVFATKPGIIKTDTDIQGVILKGIGSDFDWSFFRQNLVEGDIFTVNDSVKSKGALISNYIAKLLKLKVGDALIVYFPENPPRVRKFEITGLYETSLQEFDDKIVLIDIAHIQKLYGWDKNQISGFEVLIDDYDRLDEMAEIVYDLAGYHINPDGSKLKVRTIKEINPDIFDWLELSDTNVWIILTLMITVAGFNMISGLLIIILERTNMIGILKAIGCESVSIQKIFLYNGAFLVGKGLFWGNIIGISLCLLQYYFNIVKLDSASYYVTAVPINLDVMHLLLLNAGTMLITVAMLILPCLAISAIKPVKAIRFN